MGVGAWVCVGTLTYPVPSPFVPHNVIVDRRCTGRNTKNGVIGAHRRRRASTLRYRLECLHIVAGEVTGRGIGIERPPPTVWTLVVIIAAQRTNEQAWQIRPESGRTYILYIACSSAEQARWLSVCVVRSV